MVFFKDLAIGDKFKYNGIIYEKINDKKGKVVGRKSYSEFGPNTLVERII